MTTVDLVDLASEPLVVAGKRAAAEGAAFDVAECATARTLVSVPSATPAQVEQALLAARGAQRTWARTGPSARGRLLRQMATVLRDNADDLADLLMRESGKTAGFSAAEVDISAQYLENSAEWGLRIEGEILYSDTENEKIDIQREPLGVVAAICAWNWPLALLARKLGPALITGNTVVAKASEVTPLATMLAIRLWHEQLDMPPGVVNLVTGATEVGQALVRSVNTDMVTFTGHRDTGKHIMADAAANLTRVALELGGKAPALVLADADLPKAAADLVAARFTCAGEMCGSAERILVDKSVAAEFTKLYVDEVSKLKVGPPDTPDVMYGPLVSREQVDKVAAAVADAEAEGARLALGGGRPEGAEFDEGFWFAPTVLTGVTPQMRIARDETFGPVVPIVEVESYEHAIEVANDTRYGLASFVFTSSYANAMRATRDLDFGEVFVNRTLGEAMHAHHSGRKESGIGGEDGKHGLLKYTQLKVVYHNW